MQNSNNTNSDSPQHPTPHRRQRQAKKPVAKKPDECIDEAGYQKLPHRLRPFGGSTRRDPLDYDSHPYPSVLSLAKHLALQLDAPRTRHSFYLAQCVLVGVLNLAAGHPRRVVRAGENPDRIANGRRQGIGIRPGGEGEYCLKQ